MPIGFDFSQSESSQTQTFDETSRSTQERTIAPASGTERGALGKFLQGLLQNLESVGGLEAGFEGDQKIAIKDFQRVMRGAAGSAIGATAKSGFKSSNVTNMMGAFSEGAAGPLAQMMIGTRQASRWQGINARSQILGQLSPLLSGYFQRERLGTGTTTADSHRYGTTETVGTGQQFGYSSVPGGGGGITKG